VQCIEPPGRTVGRDPEATGCREPEGAESYTTPSDVATRMAHDALSIGSSTGCEPTFVNLSDTESSSAGAIESGTVPLQRSCPLSRIFVADLGAGAGSPDVVGVPLRRGPRAAMTATRRKAAAPAAKNATARRGRRGSSR